MTNRLKKITRSNFLIKLLSWEYWPFGVVQFPIFIYWLWLSLRARSFLFFSASNPGIVMGGMFGESKSDILDKIPARYKPKTILIKVPASADDVVRTLREYNMSFPLIFKPDLGERGFMVRKIECNDDVQHYLEEIRIDFIAQELVDLPLEFGVFYVRYPSEKDGRVTSVVMKEMLSVTGDGQAMLQELILRTDRAKLQWKTLKEKFRARLNEVPMSGTTIELVSIGNHVLGTKFLNGNALINERLSTTFDQISKSIDGFNFGRFDLRCQSIEDLYDGNLKILELNGCGAEPAHIYDPDFRLVDAIGELLRHWQRIFEIAQENHKLGVEYTSLKAGYQYYKKFKAATQAS